jgi:site-specific recombinase XerD
MIPYFSDAVFEFIKFLQVERNLSKRTCAAYKYDLRKLNEFLIKVHSKELPVDKVSGHDIRDYLSHLQMERDYRSASLSRTISSIRMFFRFCLRRVYMEKSPAGDIETPRKPRKLPLYLIDSELKRLLSAPETKSVQGARDYAILVTLGFTGVRLQELVQLNVHDIDFEQSTIRVYGKGAKERLLPMNRLVADALANYVDRRPLSEEKAVFLNRFKKRLSGRMVENIVKKYVRKAGIEKSKISPHKLRHTFATLLHMKDVDLLEIQALLGHTSITSTQIYTHTNPSKLKSAVGKLEKL